MFMSHHATPPAHVQGLSACDMDPPAPFSRELDHVAHTLRVMDVSDAPRHGFGDYARHEYATHDLRPENRRDGDPRGEYSRKGDRGVERPAVNTRTYTQPAYYGTRSSPTSASIQRWNSLNEDVPQGAVDPYFYARQMRSPSRDSNAVSFLSERNSLGSQERHSHGSHERHSQASHERTSHMSHSNSLSHAHAHKRRSSNSSHTSPISPSMYPPPARPLPAVPPSTRSSSMGGSGSPMYIARQSTTTSSTESSEGQEFAQAQAQARELQARYGRVMDFQTHYTAYAPSRSSAGRSSQSQGNRPRPTVKLSKLLVGDAGKKKEKDGHSVHYMACARNSSTVACKYGSNMVRIWSMADGQLLGAIKITSYMQAKSRSRDYLVQSHAVLSRASNLIAIATKFGQTLEIYNWADRKSLQTITAADRWAASGMEYGSARPWSQLAVYHGEDGTVDLYSAPGVKKKPLSKVRIINLAKAGLPFLPQYPEIAISPTQPLLIAAAGPRPPRRGHPPPSKETILVAWDISENSQASHEPAKVVRPWLHEELETAIPVDLVAHGTLVVSIWIPASFRSVVMRTSEGLLDYGVVPQAVPNKVVLVWDLEDNSTRTWFIPNTTACVSPDARYVAYCRVKDDKGELVVLDAVLGTQLWKWTGRREGLEERDYEGLEQLADLSQVTEVAFSSDGELLIVGDGHGNTGVYEWGMNSF